MAMHDESKRHDRAVSYLTRRRALAGGAALLTAGGTVVAVGDTASAAVTVSELSIADREFVSERVDPVLDVTAAFNYDAGTQPVQDLRFVLSVGGEEIASDELTTDRTTFTGDTTLSGRVTDSSAWSVSDFEPAVASSVSRSVTVGVTFEVLDGEGNVIVSDSAEDSGTVTVSHPQETQYVAEVGGSGSFRTAE